MSVTLVGMPGSGKSSVGRMLAQKLGFTFIDPDKILEAQYGVPLPQLVKKLGEKKFLAEEAAATIAAARGEGVVFAPGGSIVYSEEAMQHMQNCSTIVYLKASPQIIAQRTAGIPRGIISRGAKTLEELYAERAPLYERWASVTVDADHNISTVVGAILAKL